MKTTTYKVNDLLVAANALLAEMAHEHNDDILYQLSQKEEENGGLAVQCKRIVRGNKDESNTDSVATRAAESEKLPG